MMPAKPAGVFPDKTEPLLLFSVIVPTFRRPEELKSCLERLAAQTLRGPGYEVLIIDNDKEGSGEPVVQSFSKAGMALQYYKKFSNNVSEARNLGARFAKGRWLAFLDDDCLPKENWLEIAKQFLLQEESPALIFGGGYQKKFPDANGVPPAPRLLPANQYLVEGNLFFLRTEYLDLGGMRPDLGPNEERFGYHEGAELMDRHQARFGPLHRRFLCPQMAVIHLEANRTGRVWADYLSGFDSAKVFKPDRVVSAIAGPFKFSLAVIRCFYYTLSGKRGSLQKEMYRAGETLGEMDLLARTRFRKISLFLRTCNNRRTWVPPVAPPWHKGSDPKPPPALSRPSDSENEIQAWIRQPGGAVWGKIGTTELLALEFSDRWLRPFWPKPASWRRAAERLHIDSGVFPVTWEQFRDFLKIYKKAIEHLDGIHLWQKEPFLSAYEREVARHLCPQAKPLAGWQVGREVTFSLASCRWLVVSPFAETMKQQKEKLALIHGLPLLQEKFAALAETCRFLRTPQFSYLEPSPFPSWSEGLDRLTEQALAIEFDVALVGCGAWSLPLLANLKKAGKKGIHLGGETQLVFGIKGRRWDSYNIYNEHWTRPSEKETPKDFLRKENGCYW
jgi:glycosyltransferase involved in cell wall biosynthesis